MGSDREKSNIAIAILEKLPFFLGIHQSLQNQLQTLKSFHMHFTQIHQRRVLMLLKRGLMLPGRVLMLPGRVLKVLLLRRKLKLVLKTTFQRLRLHPYSLRLKGMGLLISLNIHLNKDENVQRYEKMRGKSEFFGEKRCIF